MPRGPEQILQRGAEAIIYLEGGCLVKERVKKGYRLPQLDERIRTRRTKREARLLLRARRCGISVPAVREECKHTIRMEHVDGERLKDVLSAKSASQQEKMAGLIGDAVAKLHSAGVIHGDLTTSNMILKDGELYIIDFGLGKVSVKVEDQATDLFLLFEAVKSTHFGIYEAIRKNILNTYMQEYSNAPAVVQRLRQIEKRRRYK